MKTAVVGGGAAGFFLAINLKERCPEMHVCIMECSQRVLAKVEVSGGGRCNCTNSFEGVTDLLQVYPRGHRLLKRLFKTFDHRDAYQWFERRGVPLVTQDDHCVFPRSQDAHTIINLFLSEARRLGIEVKTGCAVNSLSELSDYDFIAVTTGGMPASRTATPSRRGRPQCLPENQTNDTGNPHDSGRHGGLPLPVDIGIEAPVPSLFTFSIADERLHQLMGTVVEHATALIPGTKLRAEGPLLVTHWGMSGPCILRLSSYAARLLHDENYRVPLTVNWVSMNDADVEATLTHICRQNPLKQLPTVRPLALQQRLWQYLLEKSLGGRAHAPWGSLNKKELNRLVAVLTNDSYQISGRAPFKDEFVTCGGVSLSAVNPQTLESKKRPRLYFAGEVLDIDGVTGGFNFQAAWTTAMTVARAISAATEGHAL